MNDLHTSEQEFNLLRSFIERECGISIGEDKKYLLESRLMRFLVEFGASSFGEFYRRLESEPNPKLLSRIIDAMTTNETLWFRDGIVWAAIKDSIVPWLAERVHQSHTGTARIWSAAASTGQEAYSIGMLLDEFTRSGKIPSINKSQIEILGTDISTSSLFVAMSGRYDRISMNRGLIGSWKNYKEKYFTESGRSSVLTPEIKSMVTFKEYNLQNNFSLFGTFDLIFLRNVAIYFSEDFKKNLFDRMADAMKPGGLVLLGTAERMTSYSKRFEAVHFGRAIFYRKLR